MYLKAKESENEYNIRILVVKCPYTTYLHDNALRSSMEEIFCLKYNGYFSRHKRGVQPVDGTDLLADHTIICHETEDELIPILGAKSLAYDICNPNNITFTLEGFLQREGHYEHLNYVKDAIQRVTENGKRIAYHSSWTIAPAVLEDRDVTVILKELFAAMTFFHHQEERIDELFGLGVPKYETDKFFIKWGYERAGKDGKPFGPVNFRVLNSIDGILIHLKDFSPYVFKLAEKYSQLWEERIVLGKSIYELNESKSGESDWEIRLRNALRSKTAKKIAA